MVAVELEGSLAARGRSICSSFASARPASSMDCGIWCEPPVGLDYTFRLLFSMVVANFPF